MRTGLTPTKRAIVVMGKIPRPGEVKTRLAVDVGEQTAAELYEAFLRDVLDLVEAEAQVLAAEPIFCCRLGPGAPIEAAAALVPPDVRLIPQAEGDLGARMEAARVASGARHVVIVGSDAPTMSRERILEAFVALDRGAYAVVGPTTDGGFDLIGLAGSGAPLFEGVPWSTPEVMAATRAAAARHQLALTELELGYDLDEVDDLPDALRDSADGRAPRTRAALKALLRPGDST